MARSEHDALALGHGELGAGGRDDRHLQGLAAGGPDGEAHPRVLRPQLGHLPAQGPGLHDLPRRCL
eukprot:11117189-Alexandrium_andersonii.AAC.1